MKFDDAILVSERTPAAVTVTALQFIPVSMDVRAKKDAA